MTITTVETTTTTPIEILHRAAVIAAGRGLPGASTDGPFRHPDPPGWVGPSVFGLRGALVEAAGGWLTNAASGQRCVTPPGVDQAAEALAHYVRWDVYAGAPYPNFMGDPDVSGQRAARWMRATAARLQAQADIREAIEVLARVDAELDHRPESGTSSAWLDRARLVWEVYDLAVLAGWPAVVDVDPATPEFPVVVMVELPAGESGDVQVSWHVPAALRPPGHRVRFDGHTREEKAERIRRWLEQG